MGKKLIVLCLANRNREWNMCLMQGVVINLIKLKKKISFSCCIINTGYIGHAFCTKYKGSS